MKAPTALSILVLVAALATACGGGGSSGGGSGGASATGGTGAVTGAGTGGTTSAGTGGTTISTGGSGGAGGAVPAVEAACHAWCMASDSCDPTTTVEDCYGYACHEGSGNGTPVEDPSYSAACQTAGTAYFDCLKAQADPCNSDAITTACQPKADAYTAACN